MARQLSHRSSNNHTADPARPSDIALQFPRGGHGHLQLPFIHTPVFLLQLTGATFMLPALVALLHCRFWGVAVLLLNVTASLNTHRPLRLVDPGGFGPTPEVADRVDELAIAFWVLYNGFLSVQVFQRALAQEGLSVEAVLLTLAWMSALLVLVFDIWRRTLPWRTHRRNMVHSAMHMSGTMGSLLLLIAASSYEPNNGPEF